MKGDEPAGAYFRDASPLRQQTSTVLLTGDVSWRLPCAEAKHPSLYTMPDFALDAARGVNSVQTTRGAAGLDAHVLLRRAIIAAVQ